MKVNLWFCNLDGIQNEIYVPTYVNQKRIYHNKSIVILIQIYSADIENKFRYQVPMNII